MQKAPAFPAKSGASSSSSDDMSRIFVKTILPDNDSSELQGEQQELIENVKKMMARYAEKGGDVAMKTALSVVKTNDCPYGVKLAYANMLKKLGSHIYPKTFSKIASKMRQKLTTCPFLRFSVDGPLLDALGRAATFDKAGEQSEATTKDSLAKIVKKNALREFGVSDPKRKKKKKQQQKKKNKRSDNDGSADDASVVPNPTTTSDALAPALGSSTKILAKDIRKPPLDGKQQTTHASSNMAAAKAMAARLPPNAAAKPPPNAAAANPPPNAAAANPPPFAAAAKPPNAAAAKPKQLTVPPRV